MVCRFQNRRRLKSTENTGLLQTIPSLEARESDDSFIGGLRALQERYALYTKLSPDESQVSVYRKDGVVETSDKPIKPKKLIIIVLGAVFGIFLGCLVGLLRIVQFRR
ncbi:hypothetical protein VAG31_002898 [Pseudomonas aeruginosa]|nr:hypothetical protein [Pseudomonas aeruginosa]